MFIMTKQAVLFLEQGERFYAPCGFIGDAPEWVGRTKQFNAMVKDGMIVVSSSTKDAEIAKAEAEADIVREAVKQQKQRKKAAEE